MTENEMLARELVLATSNALARGTKHYRVSDGVLLETPKDIVKAMVDEGEIRVEEPDGL